MKFDEYAHKIERNQGLRVEAGEDVNIDIDMRHT